MKARVAAIDDAMTSVLKLWSYLPERSYSHIYYQESQVKQEYPRLLLYLPRKEEKVTE